MGNQNGTSKIDEKFIKNYDEDSDKGYIFEVGVKEEMYEGK